MYQEYHVSNQASCFRSLFPLKGTVNGWEKHSLIYDGIGAIDLTFPEYNASVTLHNFLYRRGDTKDMNTISFRELSRQGQSWRNAGISIFDKDKARTIIE